MLIRGPRSALWPLGRSDSIGSVSSGIWNYYSFRKYSTRRELYLQIRTKPLTSRLQLGGVNSDQCVWSTLIDAYFKGFDVVYVEDIAGTTSPW